MNWSSKLILTYSPGSVCLKINPNTKEHDFEPNSEFIVVKLKQQIQKPCSGCLRVISSISLNRMQQNSQNYLHDYPLGIITYIAGLLTLH